MKATLRVLATLTLVVGTTSLASASTILFSPALSIGTPVFGSASASTAVSLASLGWVSGELISFNAIGSTCFVSCAGSSAGGSNAVETAVSGITNPIVGGFLTSTSISGFLASSLPHVNVGPSGDNNFTADIANTFVVNSTSTGLIAVPTGAVYVVFSFLDDYYNDNFDASGTLGVNVGLSGVPEPATYGMMIAGLGALLAFKRVRRS